MKHYPIQRDIDYIMTSLKTDYTNVTRWKTFIQVWGQQSISLGQYLVAQGECMQVGRYICISVRGRGTIVFVTLSTFRCQKCMCYHQMGIQKQQLSSQALQMFWNSCLRSRSHSHHTLHLRMKDLHFRCLSQ